MFENHQYEAMSIEDLAGLLGKEIRERTVIILNPKSQQSLKEQTSTLNKIAKDLQLKKITIYADCDQSFLAIEREEVLTTILIENLSTINNFTFYNDDIKGSCIPMKYSIRLISLDEKLDLCLLDFEVIELLEQLKTTYQKLQSYAI